MEKSEAVGYGKQKEIYWIQRIAENSEDEEFFASANLDTPLIMAQLYLPSAYTLWTGSKFEDPVTKESVKFERNLTEILQSKYQEIRDRIKWPLNSSPEL